MSCPSCMLLMRSILWCGYIGRTSIRPPARASLSLGLSHSSLVDFEFMLTKPYYSVGLWRDHPFEELFIKVRRRSALNAELCDIVEAADAAIGTYMRTHMHPQTRGSSFLLTDFTCPSTQARAHYMTEVASGGQAR